MQVALVGSDRGRRALRARADVSLEIVAEFASISAARASGEPFDALLVAVEADDDAGGVPPEPLTPREIEVLELLAEGLSNKAIAARLGISDQTVKFHVGSIAGKLGARNRTETVRRAVRQGLITL